MNLITYILFCFRPKVQPALESERIRPTPCAEGVGAALSTSRKASVLNVDTHMPGPDIVSE